MQETLQAPVTKTAPFNSSPPPDRATLQPDPGRRKLRNGATHRRDTVTGQGGSRGRPTATRPTMKHPSPTAALILTTAAVTLLLRHYWPATLDRVLLVAHATLKLHCATRP